MQLLHQGRRSQAPVKISFQGSMLFQVRLCLIPLWMLSHCFTYHIVQESCFDWYITHLCTLVQSALFFWCSCSHVPSFVLSQLYSRAHVKLKDLQPSWMQVQRYWLSRTLLIAFHSLTPQVIFLSQHDRVRVAPLILSGLGLLNKYIPRADCFYLLS